MALIETERLLLDKLTLDDAEFILKLVNEPSWIANIGDKQVHNLDDARRYLQDGPITMYQKYGFGLYRVALKDNTPIGMCGILKRDQLPRPDIGFALFPEYCRQGYSFEASCAVLDYAARQLGVQEVTAITSTQNQASIGLLEKLGMTKTGLIRLEADGELVNFFEFIEQ